MAAEVVGQLLQAAKLEVVDALGHHHQDPAVVEPVAAADVTAAVAVAVVAVVVVKR